MAAPSQQYRDWRAPLSGLWEGKPCPALDERIERAARFIVENYRERVGLADIAGHAGLSVSRLRHLFREQTGTTPMQLLKLLRMREAEMLLARTRMSVKEIVGRVGLGDCSHFVKEFRTIHDVSPLRYRRYARPANALIRVSPSDDGGLAGAANPQPNPPMK